MSLGLVGTFGLGLGHGPIVGSGQAQLGPQLIDGVVQFLITAVVGDHEVRAFALVREGDLGGLASGDLVVGPSALPGGSLLAQGRGSVCEDEVPAETGERVFAVVFEKQGNVEHDGLGGGVFADLVRPDRRILLDGRPCIVMGGNDALGFDQINRIDRVVWSHGEKVTNG